MHTEHKMIVLLVDDQRIIGEAIRRMLQSCPEIEFHYTGEPAEALELARRLQPTVILQDLVMPDIDGLTLVKAFRADPGTATVPLVVLSSKEEAKTKAEAFALGANDYLVKLPDPVELVARIRYHSQAYIALQERNEAFEALARSQRMLADELAEAADYVRSLLPAPRRGQAIDTAWVFKPCSSLGGDAFGYFDIDGDHFAIFLLDVCNHGVGSALLSVSAMNALLGGGLVGVDFRAPLAVLEALNPVFLMEKHNNLYFTLWYGVFRKSTRMLRYASAGHPPAVLVQEGRTDLLRCRAMPVGTMEGQLFEESCITVNGPARLYVFSDGIYEITTTQGQELELGDFVRLLEETPSGAVGEVFDRICALQGRADFDDDVSLVEVLL